MKNYVCIKTIAPKGYSYFKDNQKFEELDCFLEESAGFFIFAYKKSKFLFYYDNDTSTNLLYWFVYFKRMIAFDLDLTVVYDNDFDPAKLSEFDQKLFQYINLYSKKMILPKEYCDKPYDYLKKLSCSTAVVKIDGDNMTRHRE